MNYAFWISEVPFWKKKTEIEHLCMHVKKGLGLALDAFEFLTTPLGLLVGLWWEPQIRRRLKLDSSPIHWSHERAGP
jgi:hypothetical protein